MTMDQRIVELAQAIGTDYHSLNVTVGLLANLTTTDKTSIVNALNTLKAGQGDLTSLNTTAKTSLVAAINELLTAIQNSTSINDAVIGAATTYSSSKTEARLAEVQQAILGGTPLAVWDTIKEISDYLASDQSAMNSLTTSVSNRVRFDAAQLLDATQQAQARTNIGAANAADLTALSAAVGNTDHDYVAVYNTAKA